jgi:probable rRNA maturation factor
MSSDDGKNRRSSVTARKTSPVTVLFRALPPELKFSPEEKHTLRAFARTLSGLVASGRPFTCVISNDVELRRLNENFLAHDYPTDVLSFPSHDIAGDLGDMAISAERAQAQALEFGHDCVDEIRILMLHGLLHLSGMDHEKDRGAMAKAEQKWREELGLPVTLIARGRHSRLEQ